jgi:hypothetical protein
VFLSVRFFISVDVNFVSALLIKLEAQTRSHYKLDVQAVQLGETHSLDNQGRSWSSDAACRGQGCEQL